MLDKQVIDIKNYKENKQIAISNMELLDTLKACFNAGMAKETFVIAQMANGKIGVLGNKVPKEKALQMIKFVWNNEKDLNSIID